MLVCVLPTSLCRVQDGGGDDPKPKPPTSCGDNKEKRDCLRLGAEEGDCAWCAGDFMPASCVGVKAAEWIPEQVATCKMPKKKKHEVRFVVVGGWQQEARVADDA